VDDVDMTSVVLMVLLDADLTVVSSTTHFSDFFRRFANSSAPAQIVHFLREQDGKWRIA
jgi:hypothetical protein